MNKRSENIDPGTQEWGTSIDLSGTTKTLHNTPVGVTGPGHEKGRGSESTHNPKDILRLAQRKAIKLRTSRPPGFRPPEMRRSDFGVRTASDNIYAQGFTEKCAERGVDADLLIKEAAGLGGIWQTAKPILQRFNPWNIFTAPGSIYKRWSGIDRLREKAIANVMSNKGLTDLQGINQAADALMANNKGVQRLKDQRYNLFRDLAGGTASTAALGGMAYEGLKPEADEHPGFMHGLANIVKHIG